MKKQTIAIMLAFALGITSIFGTGFTVFADESATGNTSGASAAMTYTDKKTLVGYKYDSHVALYFDENNPDQITKDGKTYALTKLNPPTQNTSITGTFMNGNDAIIADCSETAKLTASASRQNFTVKDNSGNNIGTATVLLSDFKQDNKGAMNTDGRYSATVGLGHGVKYTFTPSSKGTYTFAFRGDEDILDVQVFENTDEDDEDDTEYVSIGNGMYKASYSLDAKKYEVHISYFSKGAGAIKSDESCYVAAFVGSPSNSIISAILNGQSVNNTATTASNTASTSRSSSSSSSSSGSSSTSFSNGGVRTSGSGSAKADYTKSSSKSVKYESSEVSYSATSAKVPASAKVGGKSYAVTSIAAGAFSGYDKLKEVAIGKNIKKIGAGAFDGCKNLKTLTINSKKLTAKSVKDAFKGSAVKTVYVPANKVDAYKKIFTKANTGSKGKITVKAKKTAKSGKKK